MGGTGCSFALITDICDYVPSMKVSKQPFLTMIANISQAR